MAAISTRLVRTWSRPSIEIVFVGGTCVVILREVVPNHNALLKLTWHHFLTFLTPTQYMFNFCNSESEQRTRPLSSLIGIAITTPYAAFLVFLSCEVRKCRHLQISAPQKPRYLSSWRIRRRGRAKGFQKRARARAKSKPARRTRGHTERRGPKLEG